jgi:hypothetical protein
VKGTAECSAASIFSFCGISSVVVHICMTFCDEEFSLKYKPKMNGAFKLVLMGHKC